MYPAKLQNIIDLFDHRFRKWSDARRSSPIPTALETRARAGEEI
jgi:hypothetical protein